MSPADQRVLQLLSKWQVSLELHLRYVDLPDEQYWLIQPWPRHQRPTRWVIELARQRLAELKRVVEARVAAGDSSLCEALEIMGFLSNLVGAQHIERYIPLAEPANERGIEAITMETPALTPDPTPPRSPKPDFAALFEPDATLAGAVQPVLDAPPPAPPPAPASSRPAATRSRARAAPAAAAPDPLTESDVRRARAAAARQRHHHDDDARRDHAPPPALPETKQLEVIADAVRLLKWGREWHELPDSIARMAGRPPAGQVRLILRSHRAAIEQQSRGGRSN